MCEWKNARNLGAVIKDECLLAEASDRHRNILKRLAYCRYRKQLEMSHVPSVSPLSGGNMRCFDAAAIMIFMHVIVCLIIMLYVKAASFTQRHHTTLTLADCLRPLADCLDRLSGLLAALQTRSLKVCLNLHE